MSNHNQSPREGIASVVAFIDANSNQPGAIEARTAIAAVAEAFRKISEAIEVGAITSVVAQQAVKHKASKLTCHYLDCGNQAHLGWTTCAQHRSAGISRARYARAQRKSVPSSSEEG